jgi:hypothetical protein
LAKFLPKIPKNLTDEASSQHRGILLKSRQLSTHVTIFVVNKELVLSPGVVQFSGNVLRIGSILIFERFLYEEKESAIDEIPL